MSNSILPATSLAVPYDASYVEAIARLLVPRGGIVEVRILQPEDRRRWGRIVSGYFDRPATLASAIAPLDGKASGIYITLQQVDPALIARAKNRLRSWADNLTTDGDILSYRWLPIDIDPIRPNGISSNDAELEAALVLRGAIADHLADAGWPDPLLGMSGNGGHLLYRLPDMDRSAKPLIERALKTLAARFDTGSATVDQTLFNPSRILKLYGTMVCKGDSTLFRPHRRAHMVLPDVDPVPITLAQLQWLAEEAATNALPCRPMHHTGVGTRVDMVQMLQAAGLSYTEKQATGYTKYILDQCLFDPSHKKPDAMFTQGDDGALGYRCLHNSCSGRRWTDAKCVLDERIPGGVGQFVGKGSIPRTSSDREANQPKMKEQQSDLEDAYQRAVDAAASEQLGALKAFVHLLSTHDALAIAHYSRRAGLDGLCTRTELIQAVNDHRAQPDQNAEDTQAPDTATPTDDELAERWISSRDGTVYGLGDWRRYTAGHWPSLEGELVAGEMLETITEAKAEGIRPTKARLDSVTRLAQVRVFVESGRWDADPNVLVCANGTLNIKADALREHRKEDYVTSALPYAYDPEATCPHLIQALNTTVPDAAEFIQEFAGYALTPDTSLETSVWFCGQPGGGKSTILLALETMLGNRAGILGLAAIERSRFALGDIADKTLLISTEQPARHLRSSYILNALISGERITVERKFRDPVDIVPHAKIAWAMNDLPQVSEPSSGLFRRVKIVEFPVIPAEQRDPRLKAKIVKEGPGILNWALAGLQRLRKRGHFSIPECVADATGEFQQTNDKAARFVKQRCIADPKRKVRAAALYNAYQKWCLENGHRAESSATMSGQWLRLGHTRQKARDGNYYLGLELQGGQHWAR